MKLKKKRDARVEVQFLLWVTWAWHRQSLLASMSLFLRPRVQACQPNCPTCPGPREGTGCLREAAWSGGSGSQRDPGALERFWEALVTLAAVLYVLKSSCWVVC